MNLYRLKEEIEKLRDEKLRLEGNFQQIKKSLRKKGYGSVKEAEEVLRTSKITLMNLQKEYEKASSEIETFLEGIDVDN